MFTFRTSRISKHARRSFWRNWSYQVRLFSLVRLRKSYSFRQGIFVFLWFIGFCFMADQWRQQSPKEASGWNGRNSVQAAIAFAFFSILVWVWILHCCEKDRFSRLSFRVHWPSSPSVVIAKVFRICSVQVTKIIQLAVDKPMVDILQPAVRVASRNHRLPRHNRRNRIINHPPINSGLAWKR